MKAIPNYLLPLFCIIFMSFGCAKEVVDPEIYGSIEGQVQNSTTGEGIAFASVSTNPGTDAILTDENGHFSFTKIPTGNYTIQAEKENFGAKSVRVSVTENRSAIAQILLTSDDENLSSTNLDTEITSFFSNSRNDSTFVDVNFLIRNQNKTLVTDYEIYFQIYTTGASFFYEFEGDTLRNGQQRVGEFTKYVRQFSVDSVVVSGVYVSNQ